MILVALLSAVCFGLVAFVVARSVGGALEEEENIRLRIAKPSEPGADTARLRKGNILSEVEFIQKFLSSRHGVAENVGILLKTAKLKVSVSIFILACILAGGFSFLLLQFWVKPLIAAVISVFVALFPLLFLNNNRRRYLAKFAEHLPNALAIISGSIRSGHSLEEAIGVVARTAPYPISEEFDIAQSEIKLGAPLQKALDKMYLRVKNHELKIMTTGISIHQELGGNLSEILNNLEKTIRERFVLIREIHTLSAQGRLSAWVLFAIPIGLLAMYMKSNPKLFMEFLNSRYGATVVGISFFLDVVGFLWIRKIVQLKD